MVHKGAPDRTAGGARLDQRKANNAPAAKAAGRRHNQDDGNKTASAAAAAVAAGLKRMLKKARSIKGISENLEAHLGQKQVEQLRTPSPRKHKRRPTAALLTPAPATKAPGRSAGPPPNYMKATTSSDARIGRQPHHHHQQPQQVSKAQPLFATPAPDKRRSTTTPRTSSKALPSTSSATKTPKATLLLTRKSSLKLAIPAAKKCPAAPLFESISVSKATCSSTLKDSKFPSELELHPGGTQLDGTSVVRVCPYTYCSLNGHWHADVPPLKRFLSAKRRALRAQKSVRRRRSPSPRKRVLVARGAAAAEEMEIEQGHGHDDNTSPRSSVLDDKSDDYFLEIYVGSQQGAAADSTSDQGRCNLEAGGSDHEFVHFDTSGEAEGRNVWREDIEPDIVTPDNDGAYAEMMDFDDDNFDRLSEISVSGIEVTARLMEHVECLDQEASPGADELASSMKDCDKQKSDDGSLMFSLGDFLQQQPVQGQRSLTPSEAVELDCQEEMPEYAADGAGDDEEHEEEAGIEYTAVLDGSDHCFEDVPSQAVEKPSTVQSPEGNDQEGPDTSPSMDEVYFSLVFFTSQERAHDLQRDATQVPEEVTSGEEENAEELERRSSQHVEIDASEDAQHLQEAEVIEEVNNGEADRYASEFVEVVASNVAACMENLGDQGDEGGQTMKGSDEIADDIFSSDTEAENQGMAETNQEAQEIAGETVQESHGRDDDDLFLTEIHTKSQGIAVETNQAAKEMTISTVEETHETDVQTENVDMPETEPGAQELAEEEAIITAVVQPDCCIQDDLSHLDGQTSPCGSNDKFDGAIAEGNAEEREQTEEVETSSEVPEAAKTELMITEDGGHEATANDSMVAGEEHSDMYNEVPAKDEITPAAENVILKTSPIFPKEEPAIRRVATKPQQPFPEMDSRTIVITRGSHGEEMDELNDIHFRDPNFLPLQPEPEGEKVDLRHQMMDERKNAEEWMIDHALQRAVSKLGPARKKKVALLVEAFETVAPPPMYKTPRRHNNLSFAHPRPLQACS